VKKHNQSKKEKQMLFEAVLAKQKVKKNAKKTGKFAPKTFQQK
jgi:hypothetical protein